MVIDQLVGNAWCFGDNINTDLIYPGKFLSISEPSEMAQGAMAGLDPDFYKKVKVGDIIVAGNNFGCGSSREQAAISIKSAGICAVVAESFARIFYRNIINQGIPAFICKDAIKIVHSNDKIELEFKIGQLINVSTKKSCAFEPLPSFLLDIVNAGGNIPYLKNKLRSD